MKKLFVLTVIILLLFIFPLSSSAAATESHIKLLTDDYGSVWKVDTREGMLLHENFTSSDYTFPSEIEGYKITGISENFSDGIYIALTSIVIPDGYKYIGDYAFANCKYLESVVIPDSVEYIGDGAFSNCEMLKSVSLPKNLKHLGSQAFYGCKLIESITVPDGLEIIGSSAFDYCSALKNVTIGDSVKSIESYAFARTAIRRIFVPDGVSDFGHDVFLETPWLDNFDSDFVVLNNVLVAYKGSADIINVPKNVHVLSDYVFYESAASSINLPDTLEKIEDYAFANTTNIKNLRMPDSVTEIGTGLFSRSSVENVELSAHITKIPDYTFSRSMIKGLCLTENITEIGKYAYEYASLANLLGTNVRIPECIEFIDDYAFSQAVRTYATNITLPDDITLGNSVFFGCYIPQVFGGNNMVMKGTNPFYSVPWWENMTKTGPMILGDGNLVYYKVSNPDGDVILPEGVKRITSDALNGTSAKRIICPSTLEEINPRAFAGKDAEEIVLNSGIKVIGDNAFRSCKNLTKINWPDHISRIPDNCFEYCESLKDFDFTGVYELGEACFKNTLVLTETTLPAHIRTIEKNAFYGGNFANFYLEHIPEDAHEYCFGDFSPENVYLHIEEGMLSYNPYWNLHTLVMHTGVEIAESGADWVTLYFKYGIDSSFISGINIDGRYDYSFGSPKYEIIDDYHIKVTNIYDYLYGTEMKFDEKMSNGWCLVQYDPMYLIKDENGAYTISIDSNGVITGYSGNKEYLQLPESIGGVTVTGISEGAFDDDRLVIYLPSVFSNIEKNAFGKNVRAYADNNYEINGNIIRKKLTPNGFLSLYAPEYDNSSGKVRISFYADMGRITDAQFITFITYNDGTSGIFTEDITQENNGFFEYSTSGNVKSIRAFIWRLDEVSPLAYSETYCG